MIAERRVDALDAQVELEVSVDELDELLGSLEYEPARGLYRGAHFRKTRGVGCYHLRVHGPRAWLHWDRWDPRRFPACHLLEVPELTVGVPMAAGAAAAGGLALVRGMLVAGAVALARVAAAR